MTKYSYPELQGLWIANGGSPTTAPMAAAIALAESGGRSDAVSARNTNGSQDFGVWQINNGGQKALDPNYNAQVAVKMSQNGVNWRPWCTAYSDSACGTKGGSYLGSSSPFWKFLQSGEKPQVPPAASPTSNTAGATGATLVGAKAGDDNGCILSAPGVTLPFVGWTIGKNCLLSRSQGRAILGAVCLVGGGLVMLVGAGLILVGTRAGQAVTNVIPNPVARAAGAATRKRTPLPDADDRRAERAERTPFPDDAPTTSYRGRRVIGRSVDADELDEAA